MAHTQIERNEASVCGGNIILKDPVKKLDRGSDEAHSLFQVAGPCYVVHNIML